MNLTNVATRSTHEKGAAHSRKYAIYSLLLHSLLSCYFKIYKGCEKFQGVFLSGG